MTSASSLRARLSARLGQLALDVELDTRHGTLVLVGPNAAGKTTLLSALLGIVVCEQAHIAVGDDVLVDTASARNVPVEQRRLGYVPQDYALFPHLDVRENVAFAVRSAAPRLGKRESERRIDGALTDLGISALAGRRTQTLSGGEKQRVALARALSVKPRALLLDEPLGALDSHSRREVRTFLAETLRVLALPTVVVTHDATDARLLGDRIAVLEAGRITQTGTWSELLERPASRFVEDFTRSPERMAE